MPFDPTQVLLAFALLALLLLVKIALDIGRIAGRLSDHELARKTADEIAAAVSREA